LSYRGTADYKPIRRYPTATFVETNLKHYPNFRKIVKPYLFCADTTKKRRNRGQKIEHITTGWVYKA